MTPGLWWSWDWRTATRRERRTRRHIAMHSRLRRNQVENAVSHALAEGSYPR